MGASKLTIKLEDLMMALDGHGPEVGWFLDRLTGAVAYSTRDQFAADHPDYFDPESQALRYLKIEPLSAKIARGDISRFLKGLADNDKRSALAQALDAAQPFAAFKDALRAHPDICEDWQHDHETKMVAVAMQWLEDQRIPAVLR